MKIGQRGRDGAKEHFRGSAAEMPKWQPKGFGSLGGSVIPAK
jgi:hypothetical protein